MLLEKILQEKRLLVAAARKTSPFDNPERLVRRVPVSLKKNIEGRDFGIIAELKRASPSAGEINMDLDIRETALRYEEQGVSGISVLTCEPFFRGSAGDMETARASVMIPLLMKDFVFDDYQVRLARATGADAVLLIMRILSDEDFRRLHDGILSLGMEAVVEVHSAAELKRALKLVKNWDGSILGINNRNLDTLHTDLNVTLDLIKFIEGYKITVISESGIKSAGDVKKLREAGISGALIGESILKSGDARQKLNELMA